MSYRVLSILVVSLVFVSSPVAMAGDTGAKGGKGGGSSGGSGAKDSKDNGGDAGDKQAKATYAVVQIGNDVKVCKDSELNSLREKVNEDYKTALKAYEDAKKAATKAKKKFNDVKPVKPIVKPVASFLKSEEDANALRDKTVQKIESQKKKEKEDHPKSK